MIKGPIDRLAGLRGNPHLHDGWIRRLRWHYDLYNYDYAKGRLERPLFRIGMGTHKLGEWSGRTRTITISESHVFSHSWQSVLATLRHEMAHQYVEEVLGRPFAPPHGKDFEEACRILRADPAGTATREALGALEASSAERDKILLRIKDLLALAGSPNENEAANAMRMAQKYLLKYNLDISQIEAERRFETRHLGRCSARVQEYEYTLANILEKHFFVFVIWTFSFDPLRMKPGRILEISGTPENLEMAEYVYHYVMNLAAPLWRTHRVSSEYRGGTRLQYLAGLLRGFSRKLDAEKTRLKEEHGLVWAGDKRLEGYYRYINPRICSMGSSGVVRGDSYQAGLRDGREITVHRGLGGEGVSRGRLLE